MDAGKTSQDLVKIYIVSRSVDCLFWSSQIAPQDQDINKQEFVLLDEDICRQQEERHSGPVLVGCHALVLTGNL